jgi:hypothetical protein
MKTPIYLSGAVRHELAGRKEFGYMKTPNMGNKIPTGSTWFADNGCFSPKGERAFDVTKYLVWLGTQDKAMCLGATAPDKVGDAAETLRRSLPVLPMIRAIGYKAALVAQDGLENLTVPWNEFDVLFIGGSTEWKLSPAAAELIAEAKRRNKWVHMGRVNSFKRFAYAMLAGCDSVDGTFLAFGPSLNLPKLESWVSKLNLICEANNGNAAPAAATTSIPGPDGEGLSRSGESTGDRLGNSPRGHEGPRMLRLGNCQLPFSELWDLDGDFLREPGSAPKGNFGLSIGRAEPVVNTVVPSDS